MSTSAETMSCPACRAIDRADGVEDGNLYPVVEQRVRNELFIFRALSKAQDKLADGISAFAGSMAFVYIHVGWFAFWMYVNLGGAGSKAIFDKFPFGLLTMIVSLEAIFLATFVMITQNRQADRADVRSQIDFENNLRGEIWAVHIGEKLGIDTEHVERIVTEAIEGYKKAHTVT